MSDSNKVSMPEHTPPAAQARKPDPPPAASAAPRPPMPQPRLGALWWIVGWALVAFILYSTLAPSPDVPTLHIWDKLEHASAFFGMTFWFAGLTSRRRYPALGFWMLLLGGGIEIAQGSMGFGRDMDIHDFYADAIGIGVALALAYAGLGQWLVFAERCLGLAREPS